MTPLDAAWAAVLAAPDDDQALQVLADALMESGDPHGELIRLQLAGDEAGAKEHLAKHCEALLGVHDLWTTRFARGFLSSISLETAAEFEAVMQRPAARLLREVRVVPTSLGARPNDPIDLLVNALATCGPRTIDSIRLEEEPDAPDLPAVGVVAVATLTARFPALANLTLKWSADFEHARSESLRHLTLHFGYRVSNLGHASFPSLSTLELELPYRVLELPRELLAGEVGPKIENLVLRGTLWPQLLHELVGTALLRNLRRMEINVRADTAWYPALLERAAAFSHLDQLAVVDDRHHPEWVNAVKIALPQARILSAPRRFFIP